MTELRTPLEIAIISGDLAAVDDRLACGDAPGDRNHLGIPVLYDALRSNNLAILELLHKVGADWAIPYNLGGFTPLIYACLHCAPRTVDWLLDTGQDVNQRTVAGIGVMHVAVQRQSAEIAQLVYGRGADPFAESRHGESALLLSLQAKNRLATFTFMLQCYIDAQRSLAPKLMACLARIFDTQQADGLTALQALLPLADEIPSEAAVREYMSLPGNYASGAFRSLDRTLASRLSRSLFALMKAERVGRTSGRDGPQVLPDQTPRHWHGHDGL